MILLTLHIILSISDMILETLDMILANLHIILSISDMILETLDMILKTLDMICKGFIAIFKELLPKLGRSILSHHRLSE